MELGDHLAALRADGRRFAEAAVAAGSAAPVPTCPGWSVRDLVLHLGGVHRWAAGYVISGRSEPTSREEEARIHALVPDTELLPWFREGHAQLVEALEDADPEVRCWSFLPAPSPLRFWARRQAHETHIHRVDAEIAAGLPSACERDLGVDGIDELLNGFFTHRSRRLVADPPRALGVEPTDAGAAWTIRIEPDRRVVSAVIDAPDCTVRGAASDLYHLLWNRLPSDTPLIAVSGDRSVLTLWRERATIG